MPLPEPNDLDKAGHMRFEELEENLKQLNKDLKGTQNPYFNHKGWNRIKKSIDFHRLWAEG